MAKSRKYGATIDPITVRINWPACGIYTYKGEDVVRLFGYNTRSDDLKKTFLNLVELDPTTMTIIHGMENLSSERGIDVFWIINSTRCVLSESKFHSAVFEVL